MKRDEFRKNLADAFVKSLRENPREWKKEWFTIGAPKNQKSNKPYKGINNLWLQHQMRMHGWEDPRFMTFKQASDAGYKVKKGSKGTHIEYWFPYDTEKKKAISYEDLSNMSPEERKNVRMSAKYFSVFNAAQIEGIPPMDIPHNDIKANDTVDRISRNMGVPIIYGGDRASYSPSLDEIHLPNRERFASDEAYVSTALHEQSHSTGKRLGRNQDGSFGGENYAKEELVAEISSCFMSRELGIEDTPEHTENHLAYVQGWAAAIEKDPEELVRAIKEAEKSADYLMVKGDLMSEAEYKERHKGDKIPDDLGEKAPDDYEPPQRSNIDLGEVVAAKEAAPRDEWKDIEGYDAETNTFMGAPIVDLSPDEETNEIVNKKTGEVWVRPHQRNGKTVKGYWRKPRQKK